MRKIFLAALLLNLPWTQAKADVPPGATLARTIQWQAEKLPPEAKLNVGGPGGAEFISLINPDKAPVNVTLWKSEKPGIQTKWYALRGKIRYRDVQGVGYLDLWSSFTGTVMGEHDRYFSRTLAERGPLQHITGSSDWRDVILPFNGTDAKSPPAGLDLSLVLAGSGSVDLTDFEILQFADAGSMWAAFPRTGTRVGIALIHRWLVEWSVGIAGAILVVMIFVLRRKKRNEMGQTRPLDPA